MKVTDLMIGDWVQDTCGNPIQVKELLGDGINGEWDCAECYGVEAVYDDIKPIPLTPEILEKNGWWYYMDDMWQHEEVGFYIEKWNERFRCYDINDIKLDSVHQLQQTLRLCGLNELADNFKI